MNNIFDRKINFLLILLLLTQLLIVMYNSKTTLNDIKKRNISVENFSSIIMSSDGVISFGSERLNKIDENNIYLEGVSYLENKNYKIYGKNIQINITTEVSSSKNPIEVVNSIGKINSNGFKNFSKEGKIFFIGNSFFKFHD